jgi:hypothetical protein
VTALRALLYDTTAGDPETRQRWTHASLRQLSTALRHDGLDAGPNVVRRLLRAWHYGLHANRKRLGGPHTPERDAQFRTITRWRRRFLRQGWPVLSVDTKKKELVGCFKNPGQTWRRQARAVKDHDFRREAVGLAVPFGIYDVGRDRAYLAVGVATDTPRFAGAALRRWWARYGRRAYPGVRRLLVEADCGGANAQQSWLWKRELQGLADHAGLTITVTHYPSGAAKWNPIEHRVFSPLSQNWAGEPLVSYAVVLRLIRATRTAAGHRFVAWLDPGRYPRGRQITPAERDQIWLIRHPSHRRWNYTIRPRRRPKL